MNSKTIDKDRKVLISSLWVFFVLNILYADVISLMERTFSGYDPTTADNAELVNAIVSPEMLLAVSIVLELGIVMVVLSRVLRHNVNRWSNVVVAIVQAIVLIASLFVGTPKMYYIFFATVELTSLLLIVWYAWTWSKPIIVQNE